MWNMWKRKHSGMQIASDVPRDGLGVELLNSKGEVIAEVFRSDRDKTIEVSLFVESISLKEMTDLLECAHKRLDPFEDGTPIGTVL